MNDKLKKYIKEAQEHLKRKDAAKSEALAHRVPVLLSNSKDRGAIVHPSSKKPGNWQISWWDTRGFSGDTQRNTKEDAVQAAVDDGYFNVDTDGIFKQISSSRSFLEGVAEFEHARKTFAKA
jgi:hypothetical protein